MKQHTHTAVRLSVRLFGPLTRGARKVALYTCLVPIFMWRYAFASLFPPACRFQPTCSRYAEEALRKHGAVIGTLLTARRLLRCHPLGGHGYDPPPSSSPLKSRRSPKPQGR